MLMKNKELEKNFPEKQKLIDYIATMEIKRGSIGGLDKVDVYYHIQQITMLYDKYINELSTVYEEEIERLEKLLAGKKPDQKSVEVELPFNKEEIELLKDLAENAKNSYYKT